MRGQITCRDGAGIQIIDFPQESAAYVPLILPQYDTERILRDHLHRHGGRVEAGVTLRSFDASSDRIVARITGSDGIEHPIACRYLVGCDGAHSVVRHGLDLDYEGDAYAMTFMLGDVLVEWDLPHQYACRMMQTEDGALRNLVVAIPVPGNPQRYRLSMAAPSDYWSDDADLTHLPTLDEVHATTAPALPPGTRLSGMRWSALYRISHRIVPRYGTDRVFLVGDAAHIHPPIGGQGMNRPPGRPQPRLEARPRPVGARGARAAGELRRRAPPRRLRRRHTHHTAHGRGGHERGGRLGR